MADKIKVLIVDDSALIRKLLMEIFSKDPSIEVIGSASDPYIAWDKINKLKPDVITLDVEMPRMDGLTFLEKLMRLHPMPVVMISSLTERGCEVTLKALSLGAVDFVTKPKIDIQTGTVQLAQQILSKVKVAASAHVQVAKKAATLSTQAPQAQHSTAQQSSNLQQSALRQQNISSMQPTSSHVSSAVALGNAGKVGSMIRTTQKVIAIGASTGGTEALRAVLTVLPADSPGIVIVQHMPQKFTKSFAQNLNDICQIKVKEAEDGDRILPGHALIAPGGFHLTVNRSGANYSVNVVSGDPVNHHRPSVDVLFNSCAQYIGSNVVGVILTGMGNDGAKGMAAMKAAGAKNIAQNEATCVVFGMPKEAIAAGGVDDILPLDQIPQLMLKYAAEG